MDGLGSGVRDIAEIGRCPVSGEALGWTPDGRLSSATGPVHPVHDGVASFLTALHGDQAAAQDFYDSFGWAGDDADLLGETRAFVDTREVAMGYSRRAMARLGDRYFSGGGRYILDAGSGPLIDDDVRAFCDRFDTHICVDLSARALRLARAKLGARGLCLQADLTNLPLRDGVVDAVTCNHVLYQLPAEIQAAAFRELWRVLKPGGVAVVVYWWQPAKLPWRVERIARLLRMRGPGEQQIDVPELPHNPHAREWFEAQDWPFDYEFDIYRVVTNLFTRKYISDDWRGRLFLGAVERLQRWAPRYCGRHGIMPAIVIRKPA